MYAGEEDGSLEKSSNKDSEGANTGKSNGDRKTEKIRLNNLPFTTGADAIKQKFIVFGDIKEVNLLEDEVSERGGGERVRVRVYETFLKDFCHYCACEWLIQNTLTSSH